MKLILTTALAALLACPVSAGGALRTIQVYCTDDFSEITDLHGELDILVDPMPNHHGVAISILDNENYEILTALTKEGQICVVWVNDKTQKDGDPA